MPARRTRPRPQLQGVVAAAALLGSLARLSLAERARVHLATAGGGETARATPSHLEDGDKKRMSEADRGGSSTAQQQQEQQRLFVPLTRRARAGGAVYGVDVRDEGISRRRLELDGVGGATGGERGKKDTHADTAGRVANHYEAHSSRVSPHRTLVVVLTCKLLLTSWKKSRRKRICFHSVQHRSGPPTWTNVLVTVGTLNTSTNRSRLEVLYSHGAVCYTASKTHQASRIGRARLATQYAPNLKVNPAWDCVGG